MKQLTGRYATCKIFADHIEESALEQVREFLDHPAFQRSKARFMPDIHAGKGCVIGTTMKLGKKVVPNVIGVDIGCGVLTAKFAGVKLNSEDLRSLDHYIMNNIPSGTSIRDGYNNTTDQDFNKRIINLCKRVGFNEVRAFNSIGTLGGGNHFIEAGVDSEGDLWVTIHSGSRGLGNVTAQWYQARAVVASRRPLDLKHIPKKDRQKAKDEYRESRFQVPKGMEYLEGQMASDYFRDLVTVQEYATLNRAMMMGTVSEYFERTPDVVVESIHNYIDFKHKIIRKGAISAQEGEMVVIPWNMRDGIVIGRGLGNKDWNCSAPHGAGRVLSRTRAKETLRLRHYKDAMKGIYSSSVVESTLDEAPMAYKSPAVIEKYLGQTVEILERIAPVYSFKAT